MPSRAGRWSLALLLAVLVPPSAPTAQRARHQSRSPAADLGARDGYLAGGVDRQRIPGMSVAVLRGDRVLLARGYGYANLEHRVPASDSTVYQSGSVGKQFTSAAILMLAREGRLEIGRAHV